MKLAYVVDSQKSFSTFGKGFMAAIFEHILVPISTLMGFNPTFHFENSDELDLFRTFCIAPFFREFKDSQYIMPLKAWRDNGTVSLKDCACNLTVLHQVISICTQADSFIKRGCMPIIGVNLQLAVWTPTTPDTYSSEYTKLTKLGTNGEPYVRPVPDVSKNSFHLPKWLSWLSFGMA